MEGFPEGGVAPFLERAGAKTGRGGAGGVRAGGKDDLDAAVAACGEVGKEARSVAPEEARVIAVVHDGGGEKKRHGADSSTILQGMPPSVAAVGPKVLPEEARTRAQRARVQRSTTAPRMPAREERSEEPSRKRRRSP